jgi:Flp pilus assembly protein TadD
VLNNLGGMYDVTGRTKEAEPLYKRALAIRERMLGPGHPYTVTTRNNLAGMYRKLGRTKEAEALLRQRAATRQPSSFGSTQQ